jgi:hypothetical protein
MMLLLYGFVRAGRSEAAYSWLNLELLRGLFCPLAKEWKLAIIC